MFKIWGEPAVGLRRLGAAGLLVLSIVLPLNGWGQAVSGKIVGHVSDPTGSAVANAKVVITDLERGNKYETAANEVGNYLQTHLMAGQYLIRITTPGFAEFETTVEVHVDTSTEVNASLKVGKAENVITVTDEVPLLKADRADVSTILTTRELASLPLLNRNLTQAVLATPGTQLNDWQHSSAENPQGGVQFSANGQQFTQNGFLLDGTENNSSGLGIAVINPNLDSLKEFKVTTGNYDAEFGSVAGALLQATTKSGTNQWHGSLFEYVRNGQFNAADPFAGSLPLHWNQFGGSVGGPLVKNKLFFFFDYQGTRRHTGAPVVTTVPTAAERSGNLEALLGNYICADGSNSATPCGNPVMVTTTEGSSVPAQIGMIFDPTTGNPDGSGRLAISSNAQVNVLPSVPASITHIFQDIPGPNHGNPGDIANNFVGIGIDQFNNDQEDVRIDETVSDRASLFARYTISGFSKHAPGAFGDLAGGPTLNGSAFAGRSTARNQSIALGYSYAFSSSLVADVRFGFYRYRIRTQPNGLGSTPASDAGIPGLNLGTTETSGMPAFYINGNGGFQFGYSLNINQCNCPLKETENHFQLVNNWTKTWGNHTFGWGVDFRRLQQQRIPSDNHRAGEITFIDSGTGSADVDNIGVASGATTGLGLASFLLGVPNQFVRYFTGGGYHAGLRQTRLFFFAQDAWRVTPKLTLNYGLRYENYLPQTAASRGGAGSFDPNTGELLAAGIGTVPSNMGVKAYNLGFAPRLGVAYQIQPKTVIRAGYGESFTPSGLGAVFGQSPEYDPPITLPQQLSPTNSYASVFNLFQGPPLPASLQIPASGRYPLPDGLQVYYFFNPPSSYRIPMVEFWNLTVQHEFSSTLSFEAAYVGNVGRHLYVNPNINQAVPGPGTFDSRRLYFQRFGLEQALFETCNCDNSSYHGVQLKLQKRVTRGLDFLATYAYAKALDNTEYGSVYDNNLNWRADHGPANFDHTHNLTVANVWELPFGRTRHWGSQISRPLDLLLGGWVLNGISTFYSGMPYTVHVSNTSSVNADFNSVRPDQIGDPHVRHPNATLWYNPAAFTAPLAPFRDGDVHRNSLRGPREALVNLALAKTFTVAEGKSLEFRWENFNALNHPNLGLPANIVDQSGAGQITLTQVPMRQMQFGLHFRF
jgi:outer membrane receptor protein involved in Fe transport